MWRWILFLVGLCIAVVGVVWFVQNPGDVTIEWQDRRIDTSVGVLMLAVAVFAAVIAVIYRMWRAVRRAPGDISAAMKRRKHKKGFVALSSGMVAIAAGDASEARRHARRAEALLQDDTPLTRLLAAQSAQLEGDDKAAETFFTEMLDDPETRFLGLRGLLMQALKGDDKAKALELAQECYALRPESEWVAQTLFDLQSGSNAWIEADRTAGDMLRNRLLEKPGADRRRAVLSVEQAKDAGTLQAKTKLLKKSVDMAPDFIPAVIDLATAQNEQGHNRKAAALIEGTWSKTPHPDLVEIYWSAKKIDGPLSKVKATERLASKNPGHIESALAMARAALDAELWGEARKHLSDAGAKDGLEPPARVCRLMAELEESEHGDLAKAREWLVRAASAPGDPAWVCGSCGNTVDVWSAHCGNCGTFDGYAWGEPPHVPAQLTSDKALVTQDTSSSLIDQKDEKSDNLPTAPAKTDAAVAPPATST